MYLNKFDVNYTCFNTFTSQSSQHLTLQGVAFSIVKKSGSIWTSADHAS